MNQNNKAALNMPEKISQKIVRAQAIQTKFTGNINFPVATWPTNIVSLVQFGTDVTTLANAEAGVASKTGTVAARNAALVVVMTVWYFRNHKVNTKKTIYNWSAWIKLIIGPGGKTAGGGNSTGRAGGLPTT